jgi:hypothetical protein
MGDGRHNDDHTTSKEMPSESSSKSANGLNTAAATEALQDRGFVFTIPMSLPTPNDLRFHYEWTKFTEAACGLAGDPPSPQDRAEVATVASVDEAEALLLEVFTAKYAREAHFRKALFTALLKSLGPLISTGRLHASGVPRHTKASASVESRTLVLLEGSCAGFAMDLSREKLKFKSSYGMGQGSAPDITYVIDANGVVDTMAAVELKLHDTSCKEFVPKQILDPAKDHSPVAQALIYTQDTWHSLARRGFIPEDQLPDHAHYAALTVLPAAVQAVVPNDSISLPIVGVAAVRKSAADDAEKQLKDENATGPLRSQSRYSDGTWGNIQIFPPAGATNEVVQRSYLQAIAVFVKTMRVGLTFAKNLLRKKGGGAVTLCCSRPRSDLRLVASPIPTGRRKAVGELTITQGELYTYIRLDKDISVADWVEEVLCERVLLFGEPKQSKMSDCLVKISCATVHNALIMLDQNLSALEVLSADSAEMKTLRKRIGIALLACIMISEGCLMIVMKNLEPPPQDERFQFTGFSSPQHRWLAFGDLVKDVLLPMTNAGIVHTDICFDPLTGDICNVISYNAGLVHKLTVIDFESLLCYRRNAIKSKGQSYAISPQLVATTGGSIYEYLFWQVLWVAYGWWSQMNRLKFVLSNELVVDFFRPDGPPLTSFRMRFSGEDMNNLETCYEQIRSKGSMNDKIVTTLNILSSFDWQLLKVSSRSGDLGRK